MALDALRRHGDFGIGVMLVGYKAPTVGLVATVVMLVGASALFAIKAKQNMRE